MMLRHTVIILSAFLLYFAIAQEEDIYSVQYNKENFSKEIAKLNHVVMFYVPMCYHYRQFAPTWKKLAQMLTYDKKGEVRIAHVDCSTDRSICDKNGVNLSPTVIFFKTGNPNGVTFDDTRDVPSLMSFMKQQLKNVPRKSLNKL